MSFVVVVVVCLSWFCLCFVEFFFVAECVSEIMSSHFVILFVISVACLLGACNGGQSVVTVYYNANVLLFMC